MTKAELRKEMKSILADLDPVGKSFESMSKCMAVIQSEIFSKVKCVFGFMPMKDEVDVLPILRTALQQDKKVLIPKIIDGTNEMEFYFLTDEPNRQTESNRWGIAEPKAGLERLVMEEFLTKVKGNEILVLVPGLAFGKDNSRLGRGKGFYDRFLSELKKKTAAQGNVKPWICGICYGAQIVESVPTEENDVKMDVVL
ncbi:5-formyltetrahydrofolate cyclo-ligase [Treponema sp.]|uniref:5-formyltetrahydrofolate cyclo-ligase n=1 Tax=Treponema sp. TaxID=166 RepID=UPI00388D4211